MKKRTLCAFVSCAAAGMAWATLPPPDDAAKARAAETSAKNAWQAKVNAYQLCKVQDRIAARYLKAAQLHARNQAVSAPAGTAFAPCTDPGPFSQAPATLKPLS